MLARSTSIHESVTAAVLAAYGLYWVQAVPARLLRPTCKHLGACHASGNRLRTAPFLLLQLPSERAMNMTIPVSETRRMLIVSSQRMPLTDAPSSRRIRGVRRGCTGGVVASRLLQI
jgi:hypothetical protein